MRRSVWRAALATSVLAIAVAAFGAAWSRSASTSSPLSEFRGTIVTVDHAQQVFRLQDARGSIVRFRVRQSTRYVDCGWTGMRAGWSADVHARKVGGVWLATRVERWHGTRSHDMSDDHDWFGMHC